MISAKERQPYPRLRYSGASIGYQLASIIAGGPAPFISTWLFATCHSTFPIGIYVVICAIISIIATALLPDYTNKDISPRRIMKSRCSNGERPEDWRSLRGSLGLRPHTAGGGCSVSMVYRDCGCRPQCGKCVPLVRQMLRESTEVPTVGVNDGAD
jgi:bacterioferritin-associated ferredoxin